MKSLLLLSIIVIVGAAPAARAQGSEWEIFAGGSYLHANAGTANIFGTNYALTQNGYGWEASLDENKLGGWIGGVADFSGFYANRTVQKAQFHGSVYTYLFGPQFNIQRSSPLSMFVQPLIGVLNARENPAGEPIFYNSTKWAFSLGGGASYRIADHISVRARADYLASHFPEAPISTKNMQNNFRASIGVLFTFGNP